MIKDIIKSALNKTLKELEYGKNLFADPTLKVLPTERGAVKFPPQDKYKEFLQGDPESPNTEEEMGVLTDIVNFTRENYDNIEDFKNNAQELLALKSKFPKMLDPKQGEETGKLVYRGATIPISVLRKLSSKINPAIGEKGLYTIENPGVKITPSSGRGIHSFSTSLLQALEFMDTTAGKSNRKKGKIPVVFAIDSSEPNLLINPDFLDTISIFNEQEVMLIGDSFIPKEIYIDPTVPEWTVSSEEKEELNKILPSKIELGSVGEGKTKYKQLIPEIGEGSSKPFPFEVGSISKGRSSYDIFCETSEGKKLTIPLNLIYTVFNSEGIEITLKYPDSTPENFYDFIDHFKDEFLKEGLSMVDILFDVKKSEVSLDDPFDDINDTQYMFRLMATLKKILLVEKEERKLNVVSFSPSESSSKQDFGMGRYRLYKLFIKKAFPNAKEYRDDDRLYFYLK